MDSYPSETNLVLSEVTSNPSCKTTGTVGAACMASGLVVATPSIRLALNSRALNSPQERDTTPLDVDHHRFVLIPD